MLPSTPGRAATDAGAIAPLQRLAERIGAAVSLPPGELELGVRAALAEATATPDWLPPERRRAAHENYARHLLYADLAGRFAILAIVWDDGQMSPVHSHHCWCAVGVYQGRLSEIQYRADAAGGAPVKVGRLRREAGSLSFDPAASGIHRLANDSGAVAISLHVYGVAGDRVASGVNRVY